MYNKTITTNKISHAYKRILYIDVLNVLACFSVVMMHCTGVIFKFNISRPWFESLSLQIIVHWAIPIFVMITGSTLLAYRNKYSTKQFFKKRLMNTFIPFLIWSFIYMLWKCYVGSLAVNSFGEAIYFLMSNKIIYIFWFFYMLFSLYISIPVISLIIKNKKILFYFACLCFYTQALIPLLTKFLHIQFLSYYNIPIAGSYLGYILLGYLISTTEIKKKYRYIIYCLGILSLFVMFFGTFLLSNNIGKLDDFFLRYESITLYFLSIAVFTFAKYMNWTFLEHGLANKVIRVLSSASFGVYLIQMFVIHYYKRILNINENSFMFMTFGTLIIYLICAVLVLSIKKIPFLRRIFP